MWVIKTIMSASKEKKNKTLAQIIIFSYDV